MRLSTIAFPIFFAASSLRAGILPEDWNAKDTALETAWQLINVADWSQTRQFPRYYPTTGRLKSDGCYSQGESNPLIGGRGGFPSKGRIDATMALGAIAHFWLSTQLPRKSRHGFQYVTIATSLYCVRQNYSVAIKVQF
jgi:hypothetical protein